MMKKIVSLLFVGNIVLFPLNQGIAADSPLVAKSKSEGKMMNDSIKNVYIILKANKQGRDRRLENEVNGKYVKILESGMNGLNEYSGALISFVAYGTPSTKRMPAKERAGVLDSYKRAFKKLPMTADEWTDLILVANGSRPLRTSSNAEISAKQEYRKVYGLEANLTDKRDFAAVMIIAYGVRPVKPDAARERKVIGKFRTAYGFLPKQNNQWDIVRAIAYSGVFY